MAAQRTVRRLAAVAAVLVSSAWFAAGAATAAPTRPGTVPDQQTLFVAPGRHSPGDRSCDTARYSHIGAAVRAAHVGDTVVVCHGVYDESVLITKPMQLIGDRGAVIDASGLETGIHVVSSHVAISNLFVENAQGEGVLVGVDRPSDAHLLTSRVLHDDVVDTVRAMDNDKGVNGTETPNCDYPGDCGGGIHLNVTARAIVEGSTVIGNADGILVTDDYGPSHDNLIQDNVVSGNLSECGIVLPSHNPHAVSFDPKTFAVTARHPNRGGIYDNVVRDNVTTHNGTDKAPPQFGGLGSGSGIGLFGSGPGTGVWDNLVVGNYSAYNGLAGFTIHAHKPGGEDLNGNRIVGNRFGTNNLGGDGYDGPPGPIDTKTTGLAVYSVPKVRLVIAGNVISHNQIGMWLSTTVTAVGLRHNRFVDVATPVVRG